jgi:hypothetical protein
MKKPAFLKKKNILKALGYDMEHWVRVVQNREMFAFLATLPASEMAAMEISGEGGSIWEKKGGFKTYEDLSYPHFDICSSPTEGRAYDIIIADHVLPHVVWPLRMIKNAKAMLRPGGYLMISSSFLIHANERPTDCSRWTATGLKHLLIEGGFRQERIRTGSWGNYPCAAANLKRLGTKRGWFRSLKNDPRFPVTSWAFAQND